MLTLALLLARTVRMPNGCRLWRGAVSTKGFGTLSVSGRKLYAHREACRLAHGAPPTEAHEACHSDVCSTHDRRGRLCIEPSHVRWGTRAENASDRERVARRSKRTLDSRRLAW